ncbi:MAG: hypothetical protein O3B01_16000 [Planctomycetota bacterium]|nr:hypothetical protein [Planctomycetota bacterium]MDA1140077.1 hypothetical protein [Planctomycetota bacterium]
MEPAQTNKTAAESAIYGLLDGCGCIGPYWTRTSNQGIMSPVLEPCSVKAYGASWGNACPDCPEIDPKLAKIVEAWGELPEHIKAAMDSLVDASGIKPKDRE